MTVYLASTSNPGLDVDEWGENVNSIQDAFNASALVKNLYRATDNVWLLEASEGASAKALEVVLNNACLYDSCDGEPTENIVISLGKGADYMVRTVDSNVLASWMKARIPIDPVPPAAPPASSNQPVSSEPAPLVLPEEVRFMAKVLKQRKPAPQG